MVTNYFLCANLAAKVHSLDQSQLLQGRTHLAAAYILDSVL